MLEDKRDIQDASGWVANELRITQKKQSQLERKIYDTENFALLILYIYIFIV